jgi:hypothetical protein
MVGGRSRRLERRMPVADFPGARNWGYDGVSLFAPARCYGTPDDLRTRPNASCDRSRRSSVASRAHGR